MEEEDQLGNPDNHKPNDEVEPPAAHVESYNAEDEMLSEQSTGENCGSFIIRGRSLYPRV